MACFANMRSPRISCSPLPHFRIFQQNAHIAYLFRIDWHSRRQFYFLCVFLLPISIRFRYLDRLWLPTEWHHPCVRTPVERDGFGFKQFYQSCPWVGLGWFHYSNTHTHIRLTALCPGLPRWAGTRKEKPIWILLKQETVSGSGIRWAVCKSAPCSSQITTPVPHHYSKSTKNLKGLR